jgi:hypothetical protein
MVLNEGEPWLLWPDKVSYGINKGDIMDTFEGEDFTISMHLKILTKSNQKRTLFAKLPNYMGIDIEKENNHLLLILNLTQNGEEKWEYLFSDLTLGYDVNFLTLHYSKENKKIELYINDSLAIEYTLKENEEFTKGNEPHVIFGAGNFPHNGYNLNYCSYELDYLIIAKKCVSLSEIKGLYNGEIQNVDGVVGLYDFAKKTDYKIYDLTGNCNFIHKILN